MSAVAGARGVLAGLSAVVTGGASGIGAAIAELFAREGARVAVLDRDIGDDAGTAGSGTAAESAHGDGAETVRAQGRPALRRTEPGERRVAGAGTPGPAGPRLLRLRCDVRDDDAVRAAVGRTAEEFGGIDIVANNAGIGAAGTVADNSDEEWHRVLDVNVLGIARTSRAALPHLRRSPAAAIVNTCSVAATAGLPQRALYSASKGAVLSLTLAMAADHLREGVRVNCVNPGTADTPWVARLLGSAEDPEAERAALSARQPHGRLVTAEEIAQAVLYLASPAAGSTTGTALAVDGGMQGLRLRRE